VDLPRRVLDGLLSPTIETLGFVKTPKRASLTLFRDVPILSTLTGVI